LDELIVNHVHAIARRVEELMAHEKFKQGPEDELRQLALIIRLETSAEATFYFRHVLKEFCGC
jgi:hypothetical protein